MHKWNRILQVQLRSPLSPPHLAVVTLGLVVVVIGILGTSTGQQGAGPEGSMSVSLWSLPSTHTLQAARTSGCPLSYL